MSIDLTIEDEAFIASGDEVIKLSKGKLLILPTREMALVVTQEKIKLGL